MRYIGVDTSRNEEDDQVVGIFNIIQEDDQEEGIFIIIQKNPNTIVRLKEDEAC